MKAITKVTSTFCLLKKCTIKPPTSSPANLRSLLLLLRGVSKDKRFSKVAEDALRQYLELPKEKSTMRICYACGRRVNDIA